MSRTGQVGYGRLTYDANNLVGLHIDLVSCSSPQQLIASSGERCLSTSLSHSVGNSSSVYRFSSHDYTGTQNLTV